MSGVLDKLEKAVENFERSSYKIDPDEFQARAQEVMVVCLELVETRLVGKKRPDLIRELRELQERCQGKSALLTLAINDLALLFEA